MSKFINWPVVIALLWSLVVGAFLGNINARIEDKKKEQAVYIECLESKKENCKELHEYFNQIMGEKDE